MGGRSPCGEKSIDLNHRIDIEYPFLAVRNAGSSLQLIVSRSLAASVAIFAELPGNGRYRGVRWW